MSHLTKILTKVVLVLAVIFVILLGIRFLSGDEDTWLCSNGQWVKHGNPSASMPTSGCGTEVQKFDKNIVVTEPVDNQAIGLPLVIKGEARVFESQLNYRLKDADGQILAESSAYASSPDAGQFGPFKISVNYPEPKTLAGAVEVFDYSAKDGSEIDKVTIPVTFAAVEATVVKVYFPNQIKDPEALDCQKNYPLDRRVAKTSAPARAALEELLAGPTSAETKAGYFTSINPGVKIQSLVIKDGTAAVDFDETLEQAVGGSCRVASISSQITQTLKQFATVEKVVISVNGRIEDILQP